MKKIIILTFVALAALSCTKKYVPEPDPEVKPGAQFLFKAQVTCITSTPYVWSLDKSIVGVYADGVSNSQFILREAYDGQSGEVEIYGREVSGNIFAYLPYSGYGVSTLKGGRIPLPGIQSFCSSNEEQIRENCILAAPCVDGKFNFAYPCGTLHLSLKLDFSDKVTDVVLTCDQNISGNLDISGTASDRITDASNSVCVSGINKACSSTKPIDLWVMLPEGTYTGIFVNAINAEESITAMVKGTFKIERGKETSAEASEEHHDYDSSDFDEENVQID